MDNELRLVYVNSKGKNYLGENEYEFFFSQTPEIVWGEDWNIQCPSACGNLLPDESTYSTIKILRTEMELFCVQQNSCYSLQDCIDGCVALCFFYSENLEKYIPLQFGVELQKVISIFFEHNLHFSE